MSRRIIVGAEQLLGPWMDTHCHARGAFLPGTGRGFALLDVDDETEVGTIIAGVWFDGFNGSNMNIHVASDGTRRWLNRRYLAICFHYAFVQCNARRLTGFVESSNLEAQRFDRKLGFELEATLKNGSPDGDMLVYVMHKQNCRWLHNLGRFQLPDNKFGVPH